MKYTIPTVGVEEEYQLVSADSGELLPNCKEVMRTLRATSADQNTDAEIQHELHLNQIEMASDVCHSLAEVRETLLNTRRVLSDAARSNNCVLASAGTNPLSVPDDAAVTPKDRYESMTERFQQIARELFIFGCHVHVEMGERELGIQVMNRCRRWLPLLQAITANSPFWDGSDTGYASYRRELWAQWPMAGPPPHFASLNEYEECIDQLVKCGAIKDESFIYWDIRLPTKVPTIEFRGADVMTRIEETVGYVGLVRAMVMQATADERAGKPFVEVRPNVLTYALWQAARYGTTGSLVDPQDCNVLSIRESIQRTMDQLSDALENTGERELVDDYFDCILNDGTGADRQRRAAESNRLSDVVRSVVLDTAGSHPPEFSERTKHSESGIPTADCSIPRPTDPTIPSPS